MGFYLWGCLFVFGVMSGGKNDDEENKWYEVLFLSLLSWYAVGMFIGIHYFKENKSLNTNKKHIF